MSIRDEIAAVVAQYPRGRFDDGYYAIRWDGSVFVRLADTAIDVVGAYHAIFDRASRVLLLVQNVDPTPYLPPGTPVERETVYIATDPQLSWDERPQFYAAFEGRAFAVERFWSNASTCAGPCFAIDASRAWALQFAAPEGIHCRDATDVMRALRRVPDD